MNKLFPLHTEYSGSDFNRPYHISTWEPIPVNDYAMPAFQYEKTAGDYLAISQVLNGVSTDVSSLFLEGNELITAWTSIGDCTLTTSGRNITAFTPNIYDDCYATSNKFTLVQGETVSFLIDATLTQLFLTNTVDLRIINGSTLETTTFQNGKNGILFTAPISSSDYQIRIYNRWASGTVSSVTNGTVTCKKSKLTISGNYVTYDGEYLNGRLSPGLSCFTMQAKNKLYSDLCNVGPISSWLKKWTIQSGTATVNHKIFTASNAVLHSNTFAVNASDTVNMIVDWVAGTGPTGGVYVARLYYSDGTYSTFSGSDRSTSVAFDRWTVTATKTGLAYVYLHATESGTQAAYVDIFKTYSNEQIKLSISSTVDYAGIYYEGGFIQSLYRKANVRRNPSPQITVIGDERNGIIVKEKVITATKYQVRIRINEEMLDALLTSIGATVTITDQTGRVFTCNNLEVDKPDWYGTNGLVTLTFDDNINIFTQNI